MSMPKTHRPRPTDRVAARMVDDTAVIVRLPAGEMTTLNPAGSALWALLDGTRPLDAVVREAGARWGAAAADAVVPFVAALVEAGLVEAHADPAPVAAPLSPPALADWDAPRIEACESIETLAAGCDSVHTDQADCMVWDGGCVNGWF